MSFRYFSQNLRPVLVVFIFLLILCETTVYVVTLPGPREQFFQLYVLGANHTTTNYFPRNNPEILVGEPINWYLGVTDNTSTMQLVSIVVKIGNQTISTPDDQNGTDSPAPILTEYARFIIDNDTWEIPFVWSVSNATMNAGSTYITRLQVNNQTYPIPTWSAKNGDNFRIIFELWTWQTDNNTFEFGWNIEGQHRVAWLQVSFNMTTPSFITA
jgi:uncharacterized membrane protein